MSTKPCPQCGSTVPVHARFCGQCGQTFVATTLDEATRDPAPVPFALPSPQAQPPIGMGTIMGHAAIAVPGLHRTSPAEGAESRSYVPGHVHASEGERPTPLVSAPIEWTESASGPAFGRTVADPEVSGRAQRMRDAALAEASAPRGAAVDPLAGSSSGAAPLGKTMMLGGGQAPPSVSGASTIRAPSPDTATAPAGAGGPQGASDTSPLSRSVVVPNGWVPPSLDGPSSGRAPPPAAGASLPTAASSGNEAAASAAAAGSKQTMLGMPAVDLPPPQAPAPPAPQALAPAFKTMLGVAIPGIAPTHEAPAPTRPDRAGTLLGIAAPGIAPLAPGARSRGANDPLVHTPTPLPAVPIVPAPAPLVMEPLPRAPIVGAKKGVPAIAVVGIVFVLVAGIATAGALYVLRSGAPLSAQPQLDETGKESLRIRCESCPDGTVVSLGASSATVTAATTLLPLPAPLSIGDNDLTMKIDRPAAGRDEAVKVHVPVAYRIKADLSTLTASPALVSVRVETTSGAEVTVDGKPVTIENGRGVGTVDVTSDVEGPSDDQKTIDRKIPFSVKSKGSASPETGELVVRAGISPLHIDAPGIELYTDRATGNAAGQVKPGTLVTIDGQNVAVDPQGRFGVRVELPVVGEKTIAIVATAPPLSPRTVRAKLVRVASLDAAIKTLEARRPLGFDAYADNPKAKAGELAVVDGEIKDIRVVQGHSVLAVEEKKGCARGRASCVVRVSHGEEVKAARGDSIRAFGQIEGAAMLDGTAIPALRSALVVTKPPAKK